MKRNWMKFSAVSALALTLVVYGCDSVNDRALTGPSDASMARGGKSTKSGQKVKVHGKHAAKLEYNLLTGVLPDRKDIFARMFVGPEGGELKTSGHTLVVPAGAVSRLTEFSMKVEKQVVNHNGPGNKDDETNVAVQLDAMVYDTVIVTDEFGVESTKIVETDVGPTGFLVPVHLSLSYGWAKGVSDENVLQIVWLRKDGTGEPLGSFVRTGNKTVEASLEHFSPYYIGFPE